MSFVIASGDTAPSVTIEGYDDTGLPLTGKLAADLPTIYYRQHGSNAKVAIPLHDLSAMTDAWYSTAGNYGFFESAGGRYRIDIPAAVASLAVGSRIDIWGEASGKHWFVPGGVQVTPPVNAQAVNGVSTSPVTTLGANIGTTQPVNFTGTGASALVKGDTVDWKGSAAPAMTGDAYAYLTTNLGLLGANLTALPALVWNALTSGLTTSGSIGKYVLDHIVGTLLTGNHNPQSGDAYGIVNDGTNGNAAIKTAVGSPMQAGTHVQLATAQDQYAPAKAGDAMALTSAYDAAKTAASQTSVDAIDGGLDAAGVRSAIGMASANLDSQLSGIAADAAAASGASGGSGAVNVTITVNDGTAAIQNATVTLAINSSRYSALTNSSGVAVLTPTEEDGTYNVRIAANGYQFTPVDLVVSGDTAHTYSMTAIVITPSEPGKVTLYSLTYDENNTLGSGVELKLLQLKIPDSLGVAGRSSVRAALSNGSGVAEFTNGLPGATYELSRGTNPVQKATFTVPDNATDRYQMPSINGSP